MNASMTTSGVLDPADEVVVLLGDLIRINTSNPTHPERPAAEWVAERLAEVDIDAQIFESEPGRASVVARVRGTDPDRPPLLIHGHLDVVPADATEWTVHPFSGEVRDGYIWGRGAIDMKNMNAMTLAVLRNWARRDHRPPRDIVLAFVADEESGGVYGAHWLVDNHPELFVDCSEAISEVGGYSYSIGNDLRLYPIETAEKGINWLRLRATGTPSHGSMLHDDNAVTRLAAAVSRIGAHEFPVVVTDTVRRFLEELAALTGLPIDPDNPEPSLRTLGSAARVIGSTIRNTANPTMLSAGYKANVIPGTAEATIDARFHPGHEAEMLETLDELIGEGIDRETLIRDIAVETSFDGAVVDSMAEALRSEDPGARPVPYLMSGGTDAKSFSTLGIRCFGFVPVRLPPDLDFITIWHGIDERVPIDGLRFGVRVLDRFLSRC